ncbi:hypothetical protein GCM10010971_38610 [Silvimonas amylolytica]|uniref:Uncharacterized protein n=1 Tax=Silvimonas amylolytica TaxID=449663 RepID=A0ABQ2PST4_9NEIS|nr:hypothetical protein GCM10010971_38610 [Silvimonas amylolytica]
MDGLFMARPFGFGMPVALYGVASHLRYLVPRRNCRLVYSHWHAERWRAKIVNRLWIIELSEPG